MKAFSDEEIKTMIVNYLNWNTKVDGSGILVGVENGLVTLTGTVKSHSEKQEAYKAARHVSGVRAVNNEIMIFYPPKIPTSPDEDIAAAVRHAFEWNSHIDEATINVSVDDGIVILTGCIRHYSQRLKAETIASEMAGVKGVVNDLNVVCDEKIEDELITNIIMDKIKNTDPHTAEHIKIAAKNGFVEISGNVDDYYSESRVFDAVSHTRGVTGIKNNMEIIRMKKISRGESENLDLRL